MKIFTLFAFVVLALSSCEKNYSEKLYDQHKTETEIIGGFGLKLGETFSKNDKRFQQAMLTEGTYSTSHLGIKDPVLFWYTPEDSSGLSFDKYRVTRHPTTEKIVRIEGIMIQKDYDRSLSHLYDDMERVCHVLTQKYGWGGHGSAYYKVNGQRRIHLDDWASLNGQSVIAMMLQDRWDLGLVCVEENKKEIYLVYEDTPLANETIKFQNEIREKQNQIIEDRIKGRWEKEVDGTKL